MMSRIKISLPEQFAFTCRIPVRITDINYGGHVGNDALLSMIHEARIQFLQHFHFTEMEFGGSGMIMSAVSVEFRSELFYGETVIASVTAVENSKAAFLIYYKLEKSSATGLVLVAAAITEMVCYDYTNKKVVPLPASAKIIFGG